MNDGFKYRGPSGVRTRSTPEDNFSSHMKPVPRGF
jgi:hypothetical protein